MQFCEVRQESALCPKRGVICAAAHSCVKGTMSLRREFPAPHIAHFNTYKPKVASGS